MDVEQVQKINNLALELVKQGLAPDRDSAIAQAEEIFKGDKYSQQYNEIRETLEKVKADREPKIKQESTSELTQDEIKQILSKNTNYIVGKLKEFNDKITSMEKVIVELTKITSRIQDIPTVKDLMAKGVEQADEMEITPKQGVPTSGPVSAQSKTVISQIPENHPSVGRYKAEDVSIEKFFYRGKK